MELLERLEITVFNFKEIFVDNSEFRIDSEYYRKEFLQLYKYIKNSPILDKLVYMSDLSTNGSFADVASIKHDGNPKTIPFIRSGNVGNTFINENDLEFISKEAHYNLPKSTTHLYDVMMARKGKIGGASIIMDSEVGFNCNENVIKLDILDKKILNPFYFTTFFNSKFGIKQIERLSTGNVQPWVSIFQIRKLLIPFLNYNFQLLIEKIIKKSHKAIVDSKSTYSKSEEILLREIGLDTTNAPFRDSNSERVENQNVNIKSFKDSFGITGRLDAEYYQKKYEVITEKIKTQKYDTLKSIATINKSIEPGSNYYSNDEGGLPFMRISDFSKFGLTEPNKRLTLDFVKDNQDKIDELMPTKNTILFSKDGTVGIAHQLREDFNGVTSSAILHLKVKNEKEILPEYLTLTLNSKLVQMQAERDAGGSIIQHWRKEEIENVIVPIIDYNKQIEIAQLIEESFLLKKQSEHLLEVAKRAVEIAIEENEEVANEYINRQL